MSEIRVRFAPSPTGGLHIGGVRTALFNYLFARSQGGKFILRIEDTDQNRFVEGAESYILDSLKWFGLDLDEGPETGGPYAPYRQSERKKIYQEYAQDLLSKGYAYYAFDTPEELEEMRNRLKEKGMVNLNYNSASRMFMKNSLTLPAEDVQKRIEGGEPYVIRIKVPEKEEIRLKDQIRGWVHVHSSSLDDKVILKSDGLPTYHLANIVDDHLMKITHVIRGEEWLPSAPLHVLLYRFLGWEDTMPEFAHLPLILKSDGNGKLSKRAADKAGFPIFPLNWEEDGHINKGFREAGYLPDALLNFLALLGWNPGTDKEIFSLQELIEAFSLERIGKAGAKFDIEKAQWINHQYIHASDDNILAEYLIHSLKDLDIECPHDRAEKIVNLLKSRVTFLHEMISQSLQFFQPPTDYDEKVIRKKWTDEAATVLKHFADSIAHTDEISADTAQQVFRESLEQLDANPGKFMQPLRLVLTGQGSGVDLMKLIEILGGKQTAERINYSLSALVST